MAKISTYIDDNNITNKDIVLGSDGDENNKTKNYTVQGLKSFITADFSASEQNNIIKSYTLPSIDTPNENVTLLEDSASLINNLSPSVTINSDEILFFKLKRGDKFYVLSLKDLGKGVYGSSDTQITKDNLQVISEKALVVNNIVEDSTTDLIELGEIQPLNISQAVNAINPPIDIQSLSEGFTIFKVTNNGVLESYLFQGDSGLTGFGEQQTELADFNLIDETGVTEGFVDLSDTPNDYNGNQGNFVRVNSSEDGVEFSSITKSDVGLGNVDNTSDLNKPISDAVQSALSLKADSSTISTVGKTGKHSDLSLNDGTNPHGTTKSDVGLSNVNNTSDLNKPISTATQTALDGKLDQRTNTTVTITSASYTLQASDVDKFLIIPADSLFTTTIIVPNGLAANLTFQGKQSGIGDVEFVAESGGTLNVCAAFQKFTEGDHAYWAIRTFGSDVADLLGTLKLAE